MQVYRDLRIITARPTPTEAARAAPPLRPCRRGGELFGRPLVRRRERGDRRGGAGRALPILVGGTGLYFKALTRGLAAVPPIPAAIRAAVRARLKADGVAPLYADLSGRDPAAADRLMPGDRARITRALEVVLATGRPLADWHREGMPPSVDAAGAVKIFLAPERAELYRRIDARFDAMLAAGALDEVRALAARGLDPTLPAMKAHGVPWLIRHLAGEITLAEAAEGGKRDTRRYTKRQATWFRNQLPEWDWVAPEEAEETVLKALATAMR